jgi:hypothetical protein
MNNTRRGRYRKNNGPEVRLSPYHWQQGLESLREKEPEIYWAYIGLSETDKRQLRRQVELLCSHLPRMGPRYALELLYRLGNHLHHA